MKKTWPVLAGLLAVAAVAARTDETKPSQAEPDDPARTLRPDATDAPAATSVREAERAAALSGHAMGHRAYRHEDAGRDTPAPSPATDPHAGHRMPAADPHAGHTMPSPSPEPRP